MNHVQPAIFTQQTSKSPRARRSILAVLAGLVLTVAATTAVDLALHALSVFPPTGEHMSGALFVLALAYRIPLNAAGCYLAARLAPRSPMRHALALGTLGLVLASMGAIAMWSFGPAWYSIANIVIALPCAWLGGERAVRARRVASACRS